MGDEKRKPKVQFSVTFKTPDAVDYAVEDAITASDYPNPMDLRDARLQAREQLARWVRYGECVTIDFDLDAGTATVRDRGK